MKKAKTRRFTRFLALALLTSLLVGTFSGCNKGGGTGAGGENAEDVQVGGLMEAEGGYHVVELPRVHFDSTPLSFSSYEDFAYLIIDTGLYKLDCPAGVLLQIKSYAPQEGFSPIKVAANAAGIWVCELNGRELALRNFDTDGNLLSEKNYPGAVTSDEEILVFPSFSVDANGIGYLLCGGQDMLVLGDTATALTAPSTVYSLASTPDGQVYSFSYAQLADLTGVLRSVTPNGLGGSIQLPVMGAFSLYNGRDAADLYLSEGNDLYTIDVESGTSTKLINWLTYGTDAPIYVVPQSDGALCCLDSKGACRFEPGVLKEKKVLRLAVVTGGDHDEMHMVEKFNQENEDYVIQVDNYGLSGDYEAGVKRLITEIIAGDIPDLIDIGNYTSMGSEIMSQLIRKGYLVDLYPLLDADPELSRDSLVPAYRSVTETDGKLYYLSSEFEIVAWCSLASLWEEGETWTEDAMLSKWENAPEGTWLTGMRDKYAYINKYTGNGTFIDYSAYIDLENGTCNFESEEFIRFLKAIAVQPTSEELQKAYGDFPSYELASEKFLNGEALFEMLWIDYPAQISACDTMFQGEDYVIGGTPFSDNCAYPHIALINPPFAITTACQDVDAAWQFLRYLITEEHQRGWAGRLGLPTNQVVFDEFVKEQSTPNMVEQADGTVREEPVDRFGWYYAINEEQVARFYELLDACTHNPLWYPNRTINDIVFEECSSFLDGVHTAEETAHLIQQRVSLYVAEQR